MARAPFETAIGILARHRAGLVQTQGADGSLVRADALINAVEHSGRMARSLERRLAALRELARLRGSTSMRLTL